MHKRTTLWLVLMVAVLAAVVWWQAGREERGEFDFDEPLLEDIQGIRITSIRVDNLERSLNVELERDAAGVWYITDPIAYMADAAVVHSLLDVLTRNRCTRVPAADADAQALGFDPPRVVVEVTETLAGGVRSQRVELGDVDLDGDRVNVRVRGELMRTSRNLDNILVRDLPDYRSRRVFRFPAETVEQFARSGLVTFEQDGPEFDVKLVALREGGDWRAYQPVQAALDPTRVGIFVQGLVSLSVVSFVDDDFGDLARYGLDSLAMRTSLGIASGEEFELQFGSPYRGEPEWYAKRKGGPHVWRIEERDFLRAAMPLEEMLDRKLVRALRDEIRAIHWKTDEREVELRREAGGNRRWYVAEKAEGETAFGPGIIADEGRVDDILGLLERAEFAGFELFEKFEPSPGSEVLYVETGSGLQGGEFGRLNEEGTLRRFRRRGDSVGALLPEYVPDVQVGDSSGSSPKDLWQIAQLSAEDLRSLQLLGLVELRQQSMTLRRPGVERTFLRNRKGLWVAAGSEREVVELYPVWDSIFNLRAREHLGEGVGELQEAVEVEFLDIRGQRVGFVIGRLPEGKGGGVVAEIEGRRSVLVEQDLHGLLLEQMR